MKRSGTVARATLLLAVLAGTAGAMTPLDPDGMMGTVKHLSGKEFMGRAAGSRELDQVAALIAARFESIGLLPGGTQSGSWYQEWTDPELKMKMRNVVGILPGRGEHASQAIVIGAHYDHLGMGMFGALKEHQGRLHPGADDNASGVAVLMEMASRLPLVPDMERTIVFVAFTGEEAGRKGSRWFVQNERRYPASKMVGMINLDTVGRMEKNRLIVLGTASAQEWSAIVRDLSKGQKLEIIETTQDLDASDQKSFHEAGVPAVQFFTGANLDYHRPTDTADKISGSGLVKVATLVRDVAYYLANHPAPLTPAVTAAPGAAPPRGDRKVTIGIVPDFTYNGKGVRLSGTTPGGPAENGGMKEGDVVILVGSHKVMVLQELSDAIRQYKPGEKVQVRFLRNGQEMKTTVEVKER